MKKAQIIQIIQTISDTDREGIQLMEFWTLDGQLIAGHEAAVQSKED